MTVIEEFASFVNSNLNAIHTSRYSVESLGEGKILTMESNRFKVFRLNGDNERLNRNEVVGLEHADGTLTIKGEKKSLTIACSDYDFKKIVGLWGTEPADDEGERD